MPKVGRRRKKTRTHKDIQTEDGENVPKSVIIKRGKVPRLIKSIISDMRDVMYPYTAMKLKESSKNKLKDFISVGSIYGITHMILFSSTKKRNYIKFVKNPDGPTITFKIINYSTKSDVINSQIKAKTFSRNYLEAPILLMNGFNIDEENYEPSEKEPTKSHYNLASIMIKSLFPPLNIAKCKLVNLRRVVLFNLDINKQIVEFRHYHVNTQPTGINTTIKKLLTSDKIPNLGDYNDIGDYIMGNAAGPAVEGSESDEDDNRVELDGEKKLKFKKKLAIKLHEIGPRLKLRLVKIQEGLARGNVVYHRYVQKSQKEISEQKSKIKAKIELKEKRQREQMEHVIAKENLKKKKEKKRQNDNKVNNFHIEAENGVEDEEQEEEEYKE